MRISYLFVPKAYLNERFAHFQRQLKRNHFHLPLTIFTSYSLLAWTLLYGSSSCGFPFSKVYIRKTTHLYKTDADPKISHQTLVYRDKTNMFQINYDLPFRILWWSASFDGDVVGRGCAVFCRAVPWCWCYYLVGGMYCIVENKYIPNTQPDHVWILLGLLFLRTMLCQAVLSKEGIVPFFTRHFLFTYHIMNQLTPSIAWCVQCIFEHNHFECRLFFGKSYGHNK